MTSITSQLECPVHAATTHLRTSCHTKPAGRDTLLKAVEWFASCPVRLGMPHVAVARKLQGATSLPYEYVKRKASPRLLVIPSRGQYSMVHPGFSYRRDLTWCSPWTLALGSEIFCSWCMLSVELWVSTNSCWLLQNGMTCKASPGHFSASFFCARWALLCTISLYL